MKGVCELALDMVGLHYAHLDGDTADLRMRAWCAGGWFLLAVLADLLAYRNISAGWWNARLAVWIWNSFRPEISLFVFLFIAVVIFVTFLVLPPVALFIIFAPLITPVLTLISLELALLGFAALSGYHLEVVTPGYALFSSGRSWR